MLIRVTSDYRSDHQTPIIFNVSTFVHFGSNRKLKSKIEKIPTVKVNDFHIKIN